MDKAEAKKKQHQSWTMVAPANRKVTDLFIQILQIYLSSFSHFGRSNEASV